MSFNTLDDEIIHPTKDKISPLHSSYYCVSPTEYITLLNLNYSPKINELPSDCEVMLDAGASFGCTTLGCLYSWDFVKCTEFWKADIPLTGQQRNETVIGKRVKTIGLDVFHQPLEYGKRMNIYDEFICQNFEDAPCEQTLKSLNEADCLLLQHCVTYIPSERLIEWVHAFINDRKVKKRLIYDVNPYFDNNRDMTPQDLFSDIKNWTVESSSFLYRDKTPEEVEKSIDNESKLSTIHYIIEFNSN
jgi:hypothetical protein